MSMNGDDDLYGDLEANIFTVSSPIKKQVVLIEGLEKQVKDLETQLNASKIAKNKLETENRILSRNFYSLLKTSRSEIAKKSKIMNDLQKRLKELTLRKVQQSPLQKDEVGEIMTVCKEAEIESIHDVSLDVIKSAINISQKERKNTRSSSKEKLNQPKSVKVGKNMTFTLFSYNIPWKRNNLSKPK